MPASCRPTSTTRAYRRPDHCSQSYRIGSGFATVEELLVGEMADGRRPEVRRAMAVGLHRLDRSHAIDVGARRARAGLVPDIAGAPLWPTPHDTRFDFEASADGAEWIDDLGRQAFERLRRTDASPPRAGHIDWRVQNLAFDGDLIVAIYDWDSIAVASEPVFVGNAAGRVPDRLEGPSPRSPTDRRRDARLRRATTRKLAADRSHSDEREELDAANLALLAYTARCQHSDQLLRPDLGDNAPSAGPVSSASGASAASRRPAPVRERWADGSHHDRRAHHAPRGSAGASCSRW